jgi:exodeoxyribonuclease-3
MKSLKIGTYNVNSIRSRLHIVIPWLKQNRVDVLCLQETKVDDQHFPYEEFHNAGYHVSFSGSKGHNGVAIVSLKKPEDVVIGLDSEPKDFDRLIGCNYSGVTIVNSYVPQGFEIESPKYEYKLQWIKRLRNYFRRIVHDKQFFLWCGDINVAPEEIDVHNPKSQKNHVCFHENVRSEYTKIRSIGFVDIFRKHNPNKPAQYSFFDYRVRDAVKRKIGWRVDHILANSLLADKSVNSYIDLKPRLMTKPSDHTVVVAEFMI